MKFYDLMRYLHVGSGALALVAFWAAAFLRKGSPRHIAVGRSYLLAMSAVVVTAVPLTVAAFQKGLVVLGTTLAFVIVITVTACWNAWRAIRDKQDFASYVGIVYRVLAWTNIVGGLLVFGLGLRFQVPILLIIASIGLVTGPLMLRFAARKPNDRRWWLAEHYGGVIGGGVATHVAFFGIGLTRLIPAELAQMSQLFAWIGPLLIAVAARAWLGRKYGPRVPSQSGA